METIMKKQYICPAAEVAFTDVSEQMLASTAVNIYESNTGNFDALLSREFFEEDDEE